MEERVVGWIGDLGGVGLLIVSVLIVVDLVGWMILGGGGLGERIVDKWLLVDVFICERVIFMVFWRICVKIFLILLGLVSILFVIFWIIVV